MLGIGEKLPDFTVTGVKPKFMQHEQNGESAFEPITQDSFEGKWKIIFFYPKDFTFVCPTEIAEFARLAGDFEDRDAVVLGGSTDNEFVKLAWRRDHADLAELPIWQFADTRGELVDGLGVREPSEGVAYRATFVVDQWFCSPTYANWTSSISVLRRAKRPISHRKGILLECSSPAMKDKS